MPGNKKQHYVPQFLQKNFSNSSDKKTVRVYLKKNANFKDHVPISNNWQSSYLYGKPDIEVPNSIKERTESGEILNYEDLLADLESFASGEIREMIKNPNAYMINNSSLDTKLLEFFWTLLIRPDQYVREATKEAWEDAEKDKEILINRGLMTQENLLFFDDYKTMMYDINNLQGMAATFKWTPELKQKIFNGEYKLLKVNKELFLSDRQILGMYPIAPKLFISLGDTTMLVNRVLKQSNKRHFVDLLNSVALKKAKNSVIVPKTVVSTHMKWLDTL